MAECANGILRDETRIDVLLLNAGIMMLPANLTQDGYEIQFGINHVGQALLFRKLLPLLQKSSADSTTADGGRVVILSSLGYQGHWPTSGIHFASLRTEQRCWFMGSFFRYGQSKLANILYAREIARRYPDITAVSLHPGIIYTGLVDNTSLPKRLFIYATTWFQKVSPADGAKNQIWASSVAQEKLDSGAFYLPVGEMATKKLSGKGLDDKLAGELWDWTEKQLENFL